MPVLRLLEKVRANDPRLPRLSLLLWLALRAGFLAWLLFVASRGLYFYSGDYPDRVLIAYGWLKHPSWLLGGIWLPANFYLTAAVLRVWGDPVAAPAVFHILLSTASMALIFALCRELFPERPRAAFWAVSWLAFEPLLAELSISGGASEVDAQFFTLAAAWLWLRFEKSGRTRELLGCAALFGAAGFTRHEMWCFMAWPALSFARRAARGEARRAAAALLLMWVPAGAWVVSRAAGGDLFLLPPAAILGNLVHGVPLAATGRVAAWRLFWAYPAVLCRDYLWFLAVCVPGIAAALRGGRRTAAARYLGWLALAFIGLCLTPAFSIVFAPAHERVAVAYLPFLAPFFGAGLEEAGALLARAWRPARLVPAAAALAAAVLAARKARDIIPRYEPCNADVRAQALELVGLRPKLSPGRRVLIEMATSAPKEDPNVIWDHSVFQWTAAPYDVLDRPVFPLEHRDDGSYAAAPGAAPSVFALGPGLAEYLEKERIGFALVRSSATVSALKGLMRPVSSVGPYTLLER